MLDIQHGMNVLYFFISLSLGFFGILKETSSNYLNSWQTKLLEEKTLENYIQHIVTIFGGHKLILNQSLLKIIIGYVNFINI
jgi:hypothetical protein